MHQVTIEGTPTPSVYLPRGERRTVTVTDSIRQLVKIGAVIVVDGTLDTATEPEDPTLEFDQPVAAQDTDPVVDQPTEPETEPDITEPTPPPVKHRHSRDDS